MQSAERISRERSDNFVFRRSQLAYIEAARMVHGDVLEVGTGTGYGIEIIAPHVRSLTTVDKHRFDGEALSLPNVRFVRTVVPRLPFADRSFDFVVSFQVIEHIRRDGDFVREVHRVLRPGGAFVVTTPNAPMSLTCNPWHVREYDADALAALLGGLFDRVDRYGVSGNGKVMEYYAKNRLAVERIARFDPLDLQHRLPRWMLRLPYDIANRLNRRRMLRDNTALTDSITVRDYSFTDVAADSFDLFYVAHKDR